MIGRHKFRIGQRVRPSPEGIRRNVFPGKKATRGGVVEKVDEFNSPTVLWDGRKTADGYHPDFIEPEPVARRLRMAALEITLEKGKPPIVEGTLTIEENGKTRTFNVSRGGSKK
jgi:hypothetical protein